MEPEEELQALRGRWTICAMLFVATSINYMDRQVLSILKPALSGSVIHLQPLLPGWPTVETSIHLTDVQYGNILAAFQIAYALGVVFAGQAGGSTGLPQGLSDCDRTMEPGRDGPRAGEFCPRLRDSAISFGAGRKRQLSCRGQGNSGMVSAQGARACHGNLQFRSERRCDSCPSDRTVGGAAFRLAGGVPDNGAFQRDLDRMVVDSLSNPGTRGRRCARW